MKALIKKDPAHLQYLVEKILEVCRDMKSSRFYSKVARILPDEVIFRFLSEIKEDRTITNRGAVFTAKVEGYLKHHGLSSYI
jgi:c-di-GMP-binding flagellar brake protein YcgR